ncbi:MAG TPA: XdhC family protein [Chloroflexaceae bacterium]|nr:XdhC family protein [Chloroflexaceae bacterium]
MYDDFFEQATALQRAGEPFATATVVRAERPTSGKPGDRAIVTAGGELRGWIGGSCAQPSVVREALAALHDGQSRLVRLSPDPSAQQPREGVRDVAMTCYSGGSLEIFIEPHPPRPRLLVVGGLPVARALAHLGHAMSYHVIVADPDHPGGELPGAAEVLADLDAAAARVTPLTYAVVATHGHYDELALERLLPTVAPYVGLVASRARADAVRRYLADQGLSAAQIGRLRAPAGLDLGARRGDEIALSIMAEIVGQRRRGGAGAEDAAPATAACPVCATEVAVSGAKFTHVHEGATYYFCCPGCRYVFAQSPGQYVVV